MLRKILSLSLVAVLLSTAVIATDFVKLTSVYAAEPVTETIANTEVSILRVDQTVTDGVVSQKISNRTIGGTSDGYTTKTTHWYLMKVNIGKNWESFSSFLFKLRLSALEGKNHAYSMPISKADYDAANAVAGTETTLDSLVEPQTDAAAKYQLLADRAGKSNGSKLNYDLLPDATAFTGDSYKNGCVYIAFEVTATENAKGYLFPGLRFEDTSYWYFKVTGIKGEAIVVNDFSDAEITWIDGAYTVTTTTTSGTAMLIAASFNGTEMVDAKVATIDATKAADGVISGTIAGLKAGSKVRIFLWNSTTLAPAIGVTEF